MPEAATALKWGVEQRLEFIEFRLYWEGGVNRSDIIEAFGVSVPQASKDLTLYQERAPENAIYDKSAKRYVASASHKRSVASAIRDSAVSRLAGLFWTPCVSVLTTLPIPTLLPVALKRCAWIAVPC